MSPKTCFLSASAYSVADYAYRLLPRERIKELYSGTRRDHGQKASVAANGQLIWD